MTDDELFDYLADPQHFAEYCEACLKIRTKAGEVAPFMLNRSQLYLHTRAQAQLKERGYVRIITVKGRQQGISTYIGARGYRKAGLEQGTRVFILTHEDRATTNLFGMVKRYHEHNLELMAPNVTADNAKELEFGDLDSSYGLATARTGSSGRSQTVQFLHGSEVAFWTRSEEIATGVLQAVPEGDAAKGTEVFLESTACGVGNWFHKTWQAAESGRSDYEAVFIPWYWQEEYRARDTAKLAMDDEDRQYQETYSLDDEQMMWRQNKIATLGSKLLFQQEYPATSAEAFLASTEDTYIQPAIVAQARKAGVANPAGPRIIGVDPARFGSDRTGIAFRTGRKVHWVQGYTKKSTMEVVGIVKKLIDVLKPHRVFVDVIGLGAGVVDRLHEMGYERIVVGASASASPLDDEKYVNKRGEMWGELKQWLGEQPADLPDSDELEADLCSLTYRFDSKSRVLLESKEAAKKRGVRSPDLADAVCLTFFEPVSTTQTAQYHESTYQAATEAGY